MPEINISGTIIDFPDSSEAPNWAPAVIQFAQAVADALSGVAGAFDVPPQIYTMVANGNSNVNINSLAFPTSQVRAATISYGVFRTTSTETAYQGGTMVIVYNPNGGVGEKWDIQHQYAGDGQILFNVTDTGQIQFSTEILAGTNHQGVITFSAKALLQA